MHHNQTNSFRSDYAKTKQGDREIEKLVLRTYSESKDSEKMIQSRNQDHGHADEETVRIRDYNEERTRTRTEIRVRKRSRTGMRRE